EQARDVDARDEQDEADRSEQNEQRTTRLSDRDRAHALHVDEQLARPMLQLAPTFGISLRQLIHNSRKRRLGARHGDATLETSEGKRPKIVRPLSQHARREGKRKEDVGRWHSKPR